jgi:hypothetical protein
MYSIHTPVYYAIDDSYELTLNEKKIRYTSLGSVMLHLALPLHRRLNRVFHLPPLIIFICFHRGI